MTERAWFIDPINGFVVAYRDPSKLPTDEQLARVHAELEEITSVRLFGENAAERARRLWSEDKKGQGT